MSKKKTTPARRARTNAAEGTGIVLDLAAESRRCERASRAVLAFTGNADAGRASPLAPCYKSKHEGGRL